MFKRLRLFILKGSLLTGGLNITAITQFEAVEVKLWPDITKLGRICSTMKVRPSLASLIQTG